MATVTLLLLLGGGVIGFLLSVLGAGGSILLLPLLVIGAALPTREAVPLSLLVVMLLALGNLVPYLRRGQFAPRPALILGLPALVGSWVGGCRGLGPSRVWVEAGQGLGHRFRPHKRPPYAFEPVLVPNATHPLGSPRPVPRRASAPPGSRPASRR
jgi:hypothetical protein